MIHQMVTMVFRRRGASTRPIQRIKHIVDSQGTVTTAGVSDSVLVTVVNQLSAVFNPIEVAIGNTVNAFYIQSFAIGSGATGITGSVNWYLAKLHSGQVTAIFPNAGQTGISNLRNQIIHEEKGVPGSEDGTPMVFKGVIAIPRGMRRMREGDQWFIRYTTSDTDANFCIKVIYNSFS